MQNQPTYTAINASAGSGKTYALVQRILLLCLAYENQHDAIQHILALTFTNKAANEMKSRILDWLKKFSEEDYAQNGDLKGIQEQLKSRNIHVTLDDLHRRSKKVLEFILHHYSMLNIGTIDKFNSRLVRSFSYELGLAHQFNLEIDSEPYLIEAVDKMLDEIGENAQISDAFMDFVNYNLDNDERTNLNKTLYKKAKQFVNDIHYNDLQNNKDFDWEAYEKTKNQLREEIKNHRQTAEKLAQQALDLIEKNNLEIGDFANGMNGIGGFFKKYVSNGYPLIYGSPAIEEERVAGFSKGASTKSKNRQNEILSILPELLHLRSEVILNHIAAEKKSKILRELLPLKFNKEIQEKLKDIEDENDLVLLSKFNVLINENLNHEPSAFIYEKIGTRYRHYFFDEFQDTSKMQWQNILPLRDHTITSEDHSFTLVGDPKQSIYRFRGGDSDLMMGILNKREDAPMPVNPENLQNNWRSAANIVNFNNELYNYVSQHLNDEHHTLFGEKAQQEARQSFKGRVKVAFTEYSKSRAPYFENAAEQMHRDIQECLDNGFSIQDITILCRSAKEIQEFSRLLGMKKVKDGNSEFYIKTVSEKGLTLGLSYTLQAVAHYLKWEIQPDKLQNLIMMMYFLNKLGRVEIPDFSEAMFEIKNQTDILSLLETKYGLKLKQKDFPNLNLYNYIEYYIHEFSVKGKETDFLLNFLETLYAYTQNAGLTVKDFLKFWDEEGAEISIQASENADAITLMTIHAAKGLEFPVVFLPMLNANKDKNFSEWMPLEGMDELKSVNLSGFSEDFGTYDQNISRFNEENSYRNKIDRFCIQYVATTRPVEQLFLYVQKPSKDTHIEIFDFLMTKNPENLDEFDIYPEINGSFRKQSGEKKSQQQKFELHTLSRGHENLKNIKIATPSKNYQNTVEKVRIGIFTHEILSKIKTAEDIGRVLDSYLLNGEIDSEERDEIQDKLSSIVYHDEFSKYFQPGQNIINERDIMISENGITENYRPDRLIETKEGFYIIDFKTGEEKEKHEQQVAKYKSVLQHLGKTVLETKIIYI